MNINIALLTVTDTRTLKTDKSGNILSQKIKKAKHNLMDRKICKDNKKESLGKELAFLKKPVYEVKQILLKGKALWSEGGNGDRVDRCMTCHMGKKQLLAHYWGWGKNNY